MVHVSIIIATRNRRAHLAKCLRSLTEQTYRDYEMIVVDGGSTDGTPELAKTFPVKYIQQSRRYIPNAENCGVMAARGEILAFLDDDVIVPDNWLKEITGTYESLEVHGVGGRVIDTAQLSPKKDITPYVRFLDKLFSIVVCENNRGKVGRVLRSGEVTDNFDQNTSTCAYVEHLRGCNMSFRRPVFDTVGLFDETYSQTSLRWETDFCLRARTKGFKLMYNPRAAVYHQQSDHISIPSGDRLSKASYSNAMNDTLFILKRRSDIKDFSCLRFILRQLLIVETYLRLMIRRKNLAYLAGLSGMVRATGNWTSHTNLTGSSVP